MNWKKKCMLDVPLTSQEKRRRNQRRYRMKHGETEAQKRFWARVKGFDKAMAEANVARPRDRVLAVSPHRRARGYLQQHLRNMQNYQQMLDQHARDPGTQHTDDQGGR